MNGRRICGAARGFQWKRVWPAALIVMGISCNVEDSSPDNAPLEADSDSTIAALTDSWTLEISPSTNTPDLQASVTQLFIPETVAEVRGIVVMSDHALGEGEYAQTAWRTSARENMYGIMKVHLNDIHGNVTSFEYPEQSARMLVHIFNEMAALSEHPELAYVPFIFYGHSAGGFLGTRLIAEIPERSAGFVAFHGSFESEALFTTEALSVPGLLVVAEYDLKYIRNDTSELVRKGRTRGARWSLVVDRGAGHWDADPSRALVINFVEEVFHRRLNALADTGGGPVPLKLLPENEGWLGKLEHHTAYDGYECTAGAGREAITSAYISQYGNFPDSPGDASWIISKSFAQNWLLYEMTIQSR